MQKLRTEQSADATADSLIFVGATLVVIAVAAFAAVASYSHIFDLARQYGQSGTSARLSPLSIDGVILAASLMMLHRSRQGEPSPFGIRVMLWGGVAATLAANAASGAHWGAAGMVIAVSSGAAFVACVEALMWFIRVTREKKSSLASVTVERIAQDAQEAARTALEATMAAGNALSQRQLMARFGISRDEEREMREAAELKLGVRQPVLEHANGDAPAGP